MVDVSDEVTKTHKNKTSNNPFIIFHPLVFLKNSHHTIHIKSQTTMGHAKPKHYLRIVSQRSTVSIGSHTSFEALPSRMPNPLPNDN
jgi:hypothetical protein